MLQPRGHRRPRAAGETAPAAPPPGPSAPPRSTRRLRRASRTVLLLPVVCLLAGLLHAASARDAFLDASLAGEGAPGAEGAAPQPSPAGGRQRRDVPDVTTVLLVAGTAANRLPQAEGLLSSTARTFVNGGTTTEFATQVVGTRLDNGRVYAQLLRTGSRVFFGGSSSAPAAAAAAPGRARATPALPRFLADIAAQPSLVFPAAAPPPPPAPIAPTRAFSAPGAAVYATPVQAAFAAFDAAAPEHNALAGPAGRRAPAPPPRPAGPPTPGADSPAGDELQRVLRERKLDALRVRPPAELPTFTVRHEFSPSAGSSSDDDDVDEGTGFFGEAPSFRTEVSSRRGGKALLPKLPPRRLHTLTYSGFADFTTTVGDTVIIFAPSTAMSQATRSVTSALGPATLEDTHTRIVSTVKTFVSMTPGMVTRTVTGHSLSMQTALPTLLVRPEDETQAAAGQERPRDRLKQLDLPSQSPTAQSPMDEQVAFLSREQELFASGVPHPASTVPPAPFSNTAATNPPPTEEEPWTEPPITTAGTEPNSPITAPDVVYGDIVESQDTTTELPTEAPTAPPTPPPTTNEPTEPTPENAPAPPTTPPTLEPSPAAEPEHFSTARTQLFPTGGAEYPLGLISAVGGTEIHTGTTTLFTSLVYGTQVGPDYAQVTHSTSSIFYFANGRKVDVPLDHAIQPSTAFFRTATEAPVTEHTQVPTLPPTPPPTEPAIVTNAPTEEPTEAATEPATNPPTAAPVEPSSEAPTEPPTEAPATPQPTPPAETGADNEPELSNEVESASPVLGATQLTRLVPTTQRHTYTFLTTFFIPEGDSTSTSVSTRVTVSDVVGTATHVVPAPATQGADEEQLFASVEATPALQPSVAPSAIDTEPESQTESTDATPTDNPLRAGEGLEEVIYKTLYTTYTFLTTFFEESTTRIMSSERVVTSVVTTTVKPDFFLSATDPAVKGLLTGDEVASSGVGVGRPTELYFSPAASLEPSVRDPRLTTYTYYTTVFVDGESTVTTRTEVHTNPLVAVEPTATVSAPADLASVVTESAVTPAEQSPDTEEDNEVGDPEGRYTTIRRPPPTAESPSEETPVPRPSAVMADAPDEVYVADTKEVVVRRETSSPGKRHMELLEDQVSSESNTEELRPAPTLLLQTSFTTYTYFTTLYKGNTSDVVSNLQTVTDVVTKTLAPGASLESELPGPDAESLGEDATVPITYFTTFTFWTTLYKGGTTSVTSHEETVSNVVTPTPVLSASAVIASTAPPTEVEPTTFFTTYTYFTTSYIGNETVLNSRLQTITNVVYGPDPGLTTSLGESTPEILTSKAPEGRSIGAGAPAQNLPADVAKPLSASPVPKPSSVSPSPSPLLTIVSSVVDEEGRTTVFSTDLYGVLVNGTYSQSYASTTLVVGPEGTTDAVNPSTATPAPAPARPTGVISRHVGSVIDADGASTTLYTTLLEGKYVGPLYAEELFTTSTVLIDETKVASLLATPPPAGPRTGLVRVVAGSIEASGTTTFYNSSVLGTLLDGRYAQIIQSTSSFKYAEPSAAVPLAPTPASAAAPTATAAPTVPASGDSAAAAGATASPAAIESSLGAGGTTDAPSEGDEEDGESGSTTSKRPRISYTSKSTRAFTASIRPFGGPSRARPPFNPPRRKPPGATTITRSKNLPTVTATPATKFGGRGRSSARVSPTAAPSRRYNARGSSSSAAATTASSRGAARGRASGRVTATPALPASSRRGGTASSNRFAASASGRFRPGARTSAGRFLPATAAPGEDDAPGTTLATEEPPAATDVDSAPTPPLPSTTENPRRNPLLRLRRPPLLRASASTSAATSRATPRPSSAARASSAATSSTRRTTPAPRYPPAAARGRPGAGGLFPPRSLLRRPEPTQPPADDDQEEERNEDEGNEDEAEGEDGAEGDEGDDGDNEFEGSAPRGATAERRTSPGLPSVSIRPFPLRRRVRRQAPEFGGRTNGYQSRFRRPPPAAGRRTPASQERADAYSSAEEVSPAKAPSKAATAPKASKAAPGRYTPRPRPNYNANAASTATPPPAPAPRPTPTSGRTQFTLRKEDTSGRQSFRSRQQQQIAAREPTTSSPPARSSRRRPKTTPAQEARAKPPRLRTQPQTQAAQTSRRAPSRSRNSRTRQQSRFADQNTGTFTYSQPRDDGTITVTHRIPTEVTIPVVNGKVTEYRAVVTASPSTQVLGPHEYSASDRDGSTVLLLTSEATAAGAGGATEVTQFFLRPTPTSTVLFTPTKIGGRRTSFSHVVPSTAYGVEPVVNTLTPAAAAQAPLANLLLSQLLLGGLQPGLQPGLGLPPGLLLGGTPQPPPTPTTEYKTRATTYVTTVTRGTSTVLPITFRGKEILTTIVDSSEEVITATEFVTDTVVVTPTQAPQGQLNSLLLPALLQAQLLAGQAAQQPGALPAGLTGAAVDPIATSPLQAQLAQLAQLPSPDASAAQQALALPRDEDDEDAAPRSRRPAHGADEGDRPSRESPALDATPANAKPRRNKPGRKRPPEPDPVADSSVVTLYVSGRRPGEFSTVVSTVAVDDGGRRKRDVEEPLQASAAPGLGAVPAALTAYEDLTGHAPLAPAAATQPLESVVGDVSRHLAASDAARSASSGYAASAAPDTTGHFLSKGAAEQAPLTQISAESHRGNRIPQQNSPSDAALKRRRRVRVRVRPAGTASASGELFTPAEAQRRDRVPAMAIDLAAYGQRTAPAHDHALALDAPPPERPRKRILVTRRRPVVSYEATEALPSEAPPTLAAAPSDAAAPASPSFRRRVVVTRRRPLVAPTAASTASARRRVVVTRRRPLPTSPPPDVDFDEPLQHQQPPPIEEEDNALREVAPELNEDAPRFVPKSRVPPHAQTEDPFSATSNGLDANTPTTTSAPISISSEEPKEESEGVSETEPPVPTAPASVAESGAITEADAESVATPSGVGRATEDEHRARPDVVPENEAESGASAADEHEPEATPPVPTAESEPRGETERPSPVTEGAVEEPEGLGHQLVSTESTTPPGEELSPEVDTTVGPSPETSTEELTSTEEATTTSTSPRPTRPPRPPPRSRPNTYTGGRRRRPTTPEGPASTSVTPSPSSRGVYGSTRGRRPTAPSSTRGFRPTSTRGFRPSQSSVTTPTTPSTTTEEPEEIPIVLDTTVQPEAPASSTEQTSEVENRTEDEMTSPSSSESPSYVSTTESTTLGTTEPAVDIAIQDQHGETTSQSPMESIDATTTPASAEAERPAPVYPGPPSSDAPVTPTAALPQEFVTRVVTRTRLRTYTWVVTRVAGTDQVVMSSTEVKPHVTTVTLTQPVPQPTPTLGETQGAATQAPPGPVATGEAQADAEATDEGRAISLATRVMSNGVEVIVAGDRTTLPGGGTVSPPPAAPTTLPPSTLSEMVKLVLPSSPSRATTEVVRTHLITYTYFNTRQDGVVDTVVSTSTDVYTQKLYLPSTSTPPAPASAPAPSPDTQEQLQTADAAPPPPPAQPLPSSAPGLVILATKTYLTTFTYFTTLLQEAAPGFTTTVVQSRSRIQQEIVTETLPANPEAVTAPPPAPSVAIATAAPDALPSAAAFAPEPSPAGQEDLATATAAPSPPALPPPPQQPPAYKPPEIVTGSTIIFFDDFPAAAAATPALPTVATTQAAAKPQQAATSAAPAQASGVASGQTASVTPGSRPAFDEAATSGAGGSAVQVSDLLSLGSLGINGLTALAPVFDAMAGLLGNSGGVTAIRRNDTRQDERRPVYRPESNAEPPTSSPPRPVYIPVGGLAAAESQRVEGLADVGGAPLGYRVPDADAEGDDAVKTGDGETPERLPVPEGLRQRRPGNNEQPLLGDGIPISPGEVITANSDVIVGKPSVLGPRPPKVAAPIGMRPPPPPNQPPPSHPATLQHPPHQHPQHQHPQHQHPQHQHPQHQHAPAHANAVAPPHASNAVASHHGNGIPLLHKPPPASASHHHEAEQAPPHDLGPFPVPETNVDFVGLDTSPFAQQSGGDQSISVPVPVSHISVSGGTPHSNNHHSSGESDDNHPVIGGIIHHGGMGILVSGGSAMPPPHRHRPPSTGPMPPRRRPIDVPILHGVPHPVHRPQVPVHMLNHQAPALHHPPSRTDGPQRNVILHPDPAVAASGTPLEPEESQDADGGIWNLVDSPAPGSSSSVETVHNADSSDAAPHGAGVVLDAPPAHDFSVLVSPGRVAPAGVVLDAGPPRPPNPAGFLTPPAPPPAPTASSPGRRTPIPIPLHGHGHDQTWVPPPNASRQPPHTPARRPPPPPPPPPASPAVETSPSHTRPQPPVVLPPRQPVAQEKGSEDPPPHIDEEMASVDRPPRPPLDLELAGSSPRPYVRPPPPPPPPTPVPAPASPRPPLYEIPGPGTHRPRLPPPPPPPAQNPSVRPVPGPTPFHRPAASEGDAPVIVSRPSLRPRPPPLAGPGRPALVWPPNRPQTERPLRPSRPRPDRPNDSDPARPPAVEHHADSTHHSEPDISTRPDSGRPPKPVILRPKPDITVPLKPDITWPQKPDITRPVKPEISRPFKPELTYIKPDSTKPFKVEGSKIPSSPQENETPNASPIDPSTTSESKPQPASVDVPTSSSSPPRASTPTPATARPRPERPSNVDANNPSLFDQRQPPRESPSSRPQEPPQAGTASNRPHAVLSSGSRPRPEGPAQESAPQAVATPAEGGTPPRQQRPPHITGRPRPTGEGAVPPRQPQQPYQPPAVRPRPVVEGPSIAVSVGEGLQPAESDLRPAAAELPPPKQVQGTVIDPSPSRPSNGPSAVQPAPPRVEGSEGTGPTAASPAVPTPAPPRPAFPSADGGRRGEPAAATATTTAFVTHTLTVTHVTTETRVVTSAGRAPSTLTVLVTHTHTRVDTVTETHTLVRPAPTAAFAPAATAAPAPAPSPPDTMLVVVSDAPAPPPPDGDGDGDADGAAQRPDTVAGERNNAVLLGGVLVAAPPRPVGPAPSLLPGAEAPGAPRCRPECDGARNEHCVSARAGSPPQCECRPGFARMFPDRPCKPTYTFRMRLPLAVRWEPSLGAGVDGDGAPAPAGAAPAQPPPRRSALADAAGQGLDRLAMQSDLRDVYLGVRVAAFAPGGGDGAADAPTLVEFLLQLSANADEARLQDALRKALRQGNFSLGGTALRADRDSLEQLTAEDFDECASREFHDCATEAQCFNLRGSYMCSCREGLADLSPNRAFPGRLCSAAPLGCERCGFHGACDDATGGCRCFQWYAGDSCQINLKVLLIALVTLGAALLLLLLGCALLACLRGRGESQHGRSQAHPPRPLRRPPRPPAFLRAARAARRPRPGDKRAMILDTSSEASAEQAPPAAALAAAVAHAHAHAHAHSPSGDALAQPPPPPLSPDGTLQSCGEQRDRSLTVMIPRAKYRPVPPTSPLLSAAAAAVAFGVASSDRRRAKRQEAQLLAVLEGGTANVHGHAHTNAHTNSHAHTNGNNNAGRGRAVAQAQAPPSQRRQAPAAPGGAQSSAAPPAPPPPPPPVVEPPPPPPPGALVSAGYAVSATGGGVRAADMNAAGSGADSAFTTLRTATGDRTVSEARSCDETTVQAPTRSLHRGAPSNEEAHTMAERDVGSTFIMPHSQLYRPDRGSDVSNFDSL